MPPSKIDSGVASAWQVWSLFVIWQKSKARPKICPSTRCTKRRYGEKKTSFWWGRGKKKQVTAQVKNAKCYSEIFVLFPFNFWTKTGHARFAIEWNHNKELVTWLTFQYHENLERAVLSGTRIVDFDAKPIWEGLKKCSSCLKGIL